MPRQFYVFNDFSGGINDVLSQKNIKDNEFVSAKGLAIDKTGEIRSKGSWVAHTDTPAPTAVATGGKGLFVFSTDHKSGSSAKDTGENWMAICDAPNAQIDLYDLTGDAWTANVIDLGTVTSYSSGIGNIDFPTTSTMTDSANAFITQGFKVGDQIRITGCTTTTANNLNALLISKVTAGTITVEGTPFTVQATEAGTVVITILTEAVYTFTDEALRVADGSFGANTQTKHYSYIKRDHFNDAGAEKDSYDNWYVNDNKLTKPTEAGIGNTHPTAGTGLDIKITEGAADTGTWGAATYEIALTWIYDDNQETLPYASGETIALSNGNAKLTLEVHGQPAYDERISGARFYIRVNGTDDEWTLLSDVSMRDGARATLVGAYNAWADATGKVSTAAFDALDMNIETYEILNGFPASEKSIDIGQNGDGYKTSAIASRRCFVANVKRTDEHGVQTQMRDRIYYSPVNRFDTFPTSYFIDVIKGDSDEYSRLEEFADRIFAFKWNHLYIINISSPSPSNWFLEATHKFMGVRHSSAVTRTDQGLLWANSSGCFLFDGTSIKNLIRDKINYSTWDSYAGNRMSLGYDPKTYHVFVVKNFTFDSTNVNEAYTFNFLTNSWVLDDSFLAAGSNITNFANDWNNKLVRASQDKAGSTVTISEYDNDSAATTSLEFTLREIDFGEPVKEKRIKTIFFTYKSSASQTNMISYAEDGSASYTTINGTYNTSSDWFVSTHEFGTPLQVESLQLKFDANSSGTINIRDIIIEYRTIHQRKNL